MDFRKEQKKKLHKNWLKELIKIRYEQANQASQKTGQAASPWTLFGFLGLMLTSLLSLGKAHKR